MEAEQTKRSLIKTITWRITASLDTFIIAWVITGVCIWGFIQSATELYSYAIIGEREWFRNIKNIITAPTPLSVYLLGRTALWVPVGILNMFIILILGNILLNLQLNIDEIHVTKFILFLLMGFISVISLGFFVSGITLLTPRFGEGTAFGVTGALYLVSGALIKQGSSEKPIIIGKGAVIGMGAVVTKSVKPYTTVVGNPAKEILKK